MLWFLGSIAMTVTCTVPEACAGPLPRRTVVLVVGKDEVLCRFRAQGRSFNVKTLRTAALGWLKRPVRIRAVEVPPKCVSLATGALRRAGHEDFYFID
jgi:hypothetical protein